MIDNYTIRNSIRQLANKDESIYSVICTVADYDTSGNTCSCTPIDEISSDLLDVKLMAQSANGFVVYPKIGSQVLVTMLNKNTGYVAMFSQIDSIQLNGENFDGLVKIQDLITKLNNLENKVNALITYSQTHTHIGVTVGGGTSGISASPVTGNLTPTQQSDLENVTVKQGDGT